MTSASDLVPAASAPAAATDRIPPASAPRARGRINGVGHIAVNTADLDRFRRFYQGVVGLRLVMAGRLPHPPLLRHCVLAVTDALVLHAFEVPGYDPVADGIGTDIGRRGRIDHFAFQVGDRADLAVVASRLVAAGASDGEIRALGPVLSVYAQDPDGLAFEVTCPNLDITEAGLADEISEGGEPGWLERLHMAALRGDDGPVAAAPPTRQR